MSRDCTYDTATGSDSGEEITSFIDCEDSQTSREVISSNEVNLNISQDQVGVRKARSFSVPHVPYFDRLGARAQSPNINTPVRGHLRGSSCQQMRRASIQCDAVLTNRTNGENISKLLSDIHISAFGPNSLQAFARQYSSSLNLASNKTKIEDALKTIQNSDGDSLQDEVKNILQKWNSSSSLKDEVSNEKLRSSLHQLECSSTSGTFEDRNATSGPTCKKTFPRRHSLPMNHIF